MEYLIVLVLGALIFNEASKEEGTQVESVPVQVEAPNPVLEETPTYKPNHYFLDRENGYYTSDLSPRSATSKQDQE